MGRRFKKGDICRVRLWDDMAEEYKDRLSGAILIPEELIYFSTGMKCLCGQTFTIKEIFDRGYRIEYTSIEGIEKGWTISSCMLEPLVSVENEDWDFDFDPAALCGL